MPKPQSSKNLKHLRLSDDAIAILYKAKAYYLSEHSQNVDYAELVNEALLAHFSRKLKALP